MGEFKGRSKTAHNRLGAVPATSQPVTIKVRHSYHSDNTENDKNDILELLVIEKYTTTNTHGSWPLKLLC